MRLSWPIRPQPKGRATMSSTAQETWIDLQMKQRVYHANFGVVPKVIVSAQSATVRLLACSPNQPGSSQILRKQKCSGPLGKLEFGLYRVPYSLSGWASPLSYCLPALPLRSYINPPACNKMYPEAMSPYAYHINNGGRKFMQSIRFPLPAFGKMHLRCLSPFRFTLSSHVRGQKLAAGVSFIIHSSGSTGLPKPIFQTLPGHVCQLLEWDPISRIQ